MILFCDTSALMKLYAHEQNSDWTRIQVEGAQTCVVSQVTWVEMCSALSLKSRTNQLTPPQITLAMERLKVEWPGYVRLALDNSLIITAGELALTFGLRAYDSLQLASAQRAHSQAGSTLAFACFDKQLNAAAKALGIHTLNPM
ncbi:MAG: type II toxin-antitoxin system VapC family toxin [Rhodoferax sp.]|uniref:type II toxin-antitoxin system VapC family toxin n=1 Tax=Rhodoferax sp. TaxID=50421 RepID=UPI003BB1C7EA